MNPTWPHAMAKRLGLTGAIEFTKTRVDQTLHVPCRRGDHIVDVRVNASMPPDVVAKRMLGAGWTIGTALICPEHTRKSKKKQEETAMAANGTAIAASAPARSDEAKRAHRLVMQALEDYYDEANKRYRPSYTDARIAEETGAAEAHVKKTREEFFGPLGEPAELVAVKAELAALEHAFTKTIGSFNEQLNAAKDRVARICKLNGWTA